VVHSGSFGMSMLDALSGDKCKTKKVAGWMSVYLGLCHKEEVVMFANKLRLGPNNQMDDVTFQVMATDITTSVSTHHGIKLHINAFFDSRMFETGLALKARIESRQCEEVCVRQV
jgi:hypothetical protein